MSLKQIPWHLRTRYKNRQNDRGNGSFDTNHHSAGGKAYHLNQQALRKCKREEKRLGQRALREVGRQDLAERMEEG